MLRILAPEFVTRDGGALFNLELSKHTSLSSEDSSCYELVIEFVTGAGGALFSSHLPKHKSLS